MTDIKRIEAGKRMSQVAIYGDIVWLSGQCGTAGDSITRQTQQALEKVGKLLEQAGSDKTRIVNTVIWLAKIEDYDEVNAVWDAWVPNGLAPTRSCCEARLGGNGYDIEIICVAVTN